MYVCMHIVLFKIKWFRVILLFNCTNDRSFPDLLNPLMKIPFKAVCFSPASGTGLPDLYSTKSTTTASNDESLQHKMQQYWQQNNCHHNKDHDVLAFDSLSAWRDWYNLYQGGGPVLVTGSLHLVGAIMAMFSIPVE